MENPFFNSKSIKHKIRLFYNLKAVKIIYKYILHNFKKGSIKRFLHYLQKGHIIRKIIITKHLTKKNINLQIGGGIHNINGWLNGDLIGGNIYLNASKILPFPNKSIDFIFTEQFIEHLSLNDARKFTKEAYRILKKNGVLRISTPDLDLLYMVYHDKNPYVRLNDALMRHKRLHNHKLINSCEFINDYFHLWGHKFIYNEDCLRFILLDAGFSDIKRCSFSDSNFVTLKNKERHADCKWMKKGWTLILEAKK